MEFLQSYKENIDSASQEDHDKVEAMYRLLSLIKKSVFNTDFLIKLFLFLGYKNKNLNGITKYTKNYICNCLST